MLRELSIVFLVCAACTSKAGEGESEDPGEPKPAAEASKAEPEPAAPPFEEPNYEATYGDDVEVAGLYTVSPVKGGKRLQAGYLVVDGKDESWIMSYRPDPSLYEFVDKRVVVKGRTYTNSPYVQSVGGTHFDLYEMKLAPGETAYDPKPTKLPAPPRGKTVADLEARAGRWVHAVGVLRLPDADEGEPWPVGEFALDGQASVVRASGLESRIREFDRKQATVLAHVVKEPEGITLRIGKICNGVVTECEVDRDNERKPGLK